jgi:peroxiredoxin
MSAALVFVGALALCDLLLTLLLVRWVLQFAKRSAASGRMPWLAPGTQVPDFEAVTVEGQRVSLVGLRGQQSVIGLFSATCEPCREQVPVFARRAADYGGPERVFAVVIGIAAQADEFVAELSGKATVFREEARGPVAEAFSAHAFPSVYLLDPDGKVVAGGPSIAAIARPRQDAMAAQR